RAVASGRTGCAGGSRRRLRVERYRARVGRRGRGHAPVILDVAARRAELTPRRRALWWQGAWFSYAELNDRAVRMASALLDAGVKRGDRVAILAHNHVAHID